MGKGTRLFWKLVGWSTVGTGVMAMSVGAPFLGIIVLGCGVYVLWDFRGW
jgi:hypothetical protein